MSWKLLVEEAKRRAKVFSELDKHLAKLVEVAKKIDPHCEVYLFGSVAEKKNLPSSDIDVLVVTSAKPEVVMAEMWENGIRDPFEVHVVDRERMSLYASRSKLVRLG